MELDLASRQPPEVVQARDGLVNRAVVLMPLVEVNRGRVDGEVVKHRAQRLMWAVAEHLARYHEYLAAVEVIGRPRAAAAGARQVRRPAEASTHRRRGLGLDASW
jgi:hypothetical protein